MNDQDFSDLGPALFGMGRFPEDSSFVEADLDSNPSSQFAKWLREAIERELLFPNSMTLATCTPDGKPSARIVLLKGIDRRGFIFYTNYESRKGGELAANPHAALVFLWAEMQRQVRVTGTVSPVSSGESDAYFKSRPRGSRLGAWASRQSEVIPRRADLEASVEELDRVYEDRDIPRPPFWGGYVLDPVEIEFWQGRADRLHDRFRYRPATQGAWAQGAWTVERLSP